MIRLVEVIGKCKMMSLFNFITCLFQYFSHQPNQKPDLVSLISSFLVSWNQEKLAIRLDMFYLLVNVVDCSADASFVGRAEVNFLQFFYFVFGKVLIKWWINFLAPACICLLKNIIMMLYVLLDKYILFVIYYSYWLIILVEEHIP